MRTISPAHQQNQRQIPLLLQPQGHIRHGVTDQPRQNRRDDDGQAEIDEAGAGQRRHNIRTQLQRLAHRLAAGINRFRARQHRQQTRIGHAGCIRADGDEERLAKIGHASDAIFQVEADRHQCVDAKERQDGDGGGTDVDVHRCKSRVRWKSSVKPWGRISSTTMMMKKGIAGLNARSTPKFTLRNSMTVCSEKATTYAPRMVPEKLCKPPRIAAAKTDRIATQPISGLTAVCKPQSAPATPRQPANQQPGMALHPFDRDANDARQIEIVRQGAHLPSQWRGVEQQRQQDDKRDARRRHPEEDVGQDQVTLAHDDLQRDADARIKQVVLIGDHEEDVTDDQPHREGRQDQRIKRDLPPFQRLEHRDMAQPGDQRARQESGCHDRQRVDLARQRDDERGKSADRHIFGMGEIGQAHDAECERDAQRHQSIQAADLDGIDD